MQENTNKAIAYNSIVLYGKMVVNTICALLTTRFALQALGVVDYGLYAVLGGIISFISIFNTIMLLTSNRFIAVAIGKGNMKEINEQFNVNLVIHVAIALLALLVAYPVGDWYIPRYVNYDGPLSNAMMVYFISVAGSILSFIGVPYNGLLMAKEKFIVFSLVDIICHILKLAIAWLLIYYVQNKLFIYTLTMAFLTAIPTLVYIIYCRRHYGEMVRMRLVRDRGKYKMVFNFSAWVSLGAVASVGRNQGAALVVNAFFDTVMNTAMGVASSINSYVSIFAQTVKQPMAPQITKSYANGDQKRTDELLIMSTKYTFLLTLLIGSFFLVAPEWILSLWLGDAPPSASIFLVLFIVDNLVQSLNSGVGIFILASGKIGFYQVSMSFLNIFSVVLGYLVLQGGEPAYYLLVAYIFVSIVTFFVVQFVLHRQLKYDNSKLWKCSFIPSLMVCTLFVPVLFVPVIVHPIINIIISFCYLCVIEIFVGLSKKEREKLRLVAVKGVSRIIKK